MRDGLWSCFEPRIAIPTLDEDAEEIATPTRQFSLLEITSGFPDDSREADERAAERRLRELRARVKAARAVVSATPGLTETLAHDWQRAARFYVRFGITEAQFRSGVPWDSCQSSDGDELDQRWRRGPVKVPETSAGTQGTDPGHVAPNS